MYTFINKKYCIHIYKNQNTNISNAVSAFILCTQSIENLNTFYKIKILVTF